MTIIVLLFIPPIVSVILATIAAAVPTFVCLSSNTQCQTQRILAVAMPGSNPLIVNEQTAGDGADVQKAPAPGAPTAMSPERMRELMSGFPSGVVGSWVRMATGCMFFAGGAFPRPAFAWSGTCADGFGQGEGRLTIDLGDIHVVQEGSMERGILFGPGRVIERDGSIWTGVFWWGLIDGPITVQSPQGYRYSGGWHLGRAIGFGQADWPGGQRYIGDWKDGKPNGAGIMRYPSGQTYYGQFRDDDREGYGIQIQAANIYLAGEWKQDKPSGSVVASFDGGDHFSGTMIAGKKSGYGVFRWESGAAYSGEWKADLPNGNGEYRSASGMTVVDRWIDGCPQSNGSPCLFKELNR